MRRPDLAAILALRELDPTVPDPFEKSAEAASGKLRRTCGGLPFVLENGKGSTRSGVDKDGKAWSCMMAVDYGFIAGTLGEDGDEVDAFLADDCTADSTLPVYVIDQKRVDTGAHDEQKLMIGFASEAEARKAYLDSYEEGWDGIEAIRELPIEDVVAKVEKANGRTKLKF